MRLLFAPLIPFIGHPDRIAVVTCLWFVLAVLVTIWRKKIAWPAVVAGIAWAVFAAWEWHCQRMGYNIRVDLFLIYPVMLVVTLGSALATAFPGIAQRQFPDQFSLRGLLITMTLVALGLGLLVWLAA